MVTAECPVCGGDGYIEIGDRPVNGADGSQGMAAAAVACPCAGGDPDDLPPMDPRIERGLRNQGVTMDIGTYVIVRTYSAGVFAGTLARQEGKQVTLTNARRIWYWSGAASLSELAVHGTSKPTDCKFPVAVAQIDVTEAIEILTVTDEARASIDAVPVWTEHAKAGTR